MDRSRRSLLRAVLPAVLGVALPLVPSAGAPALAGARQAGPATRRLAWLTARPLSPLAERLAADSRAFVYDPDGRVAAVFGLPASEAGMVLYPVTRWRPLPDGYTPKDLVSRLGRPLRLGVNAELAALFATSRREGAYPVLISGFRSVEYQAGVFEAAVERQLRLDEKIDRAEAERRAARQVAPPGRSQHQLGTTADLSSQEIGNAILPAFAETRAYRWLAQHAWRYGFVLPFTEAAEPRTGYVAEPWHIRWLGRPLAALLWEQGYFNSAVPTVDDWLLAVEELMAPSHGVAGGTVRLSV